MRKFLALVATLVLAVINLGMLFGWGMGGGFYNVTHTPDISDYLQVLGVLAVQVIIINGIAVSWVIALRKCTSKTLIRIFVISIPAALLIMKFAEG